MSIHYILLHMMENVISRKKMIMLKRWTFYILGFVEELFGQVLLKFGLLFISTSGQTARANKENKHKIWL